MALSLPQQLEQRDFARMRAYQENLSFYSGSHWPEPARRRERRLTFNYVRTFAHKATAALLAGMHVAVEPLDASPEAEARAAVARRVLLDVAEGNDLQELDFETELDAAVLGDGCYKVTWESTAMGPGVRVTSPDVQGLFAWWVGDDVAKVWRVASRYRLTAEETELLYGVTPSSAEAVVVEAWTAESMQPVGRKRPAGGAAKSLRLHPLRRLPQPAGAQAVLGQRGHNPAHGAAAGDQPRLLAAFHHPGVVGQPHRCVGGRGGVAGHRRAARSGLGGAGARPRLPARPAAGRRRPAAHRVHRAALPGAARPLGDAAHRLWRTAAATSPAWPWRWSCTPWCSVSPASECCATPCTGSGRR